jgi:hypothetical protein
MNSKEIEKITNGLSKVSVSTKEIIKDHNFHEAIDIIVPYLDKYKDVENLELEFRLGFLEDSGSEKTKFDPSVNEDFFSKILKRLGTNNKWDNKVRSVTNDYFSNGKRLTIDCDNKRSCMRKEKLCVLDFTFEGTPFDIRICFSKETPVDVSEFETSDFSRNKDRMSYKYKTWFYDITKVTTTDNTCEETNFEIELECNVQESLKRMNKVYFIHSSLLKVKDLVNMCEKVTPESKLYLISSKDY